MLKTGVMMRIILCSFFNVLCYADYASKEHAWDTFSKTADLLEGSPVKEKYELRLLERINGIFVRKESFFIKGALPGAELLDILGEKAIG